MIYRAYGQTGINVSAIGCGGMRFPDQNDADRCAALVKAAYDQGVTFFDTAPGYGKSEDLFGLAFKEMAKTRDSKPFHVSTKTDKASPSDVRRELEESLRRLNLECIDFYHVWCILHRRSYDRRKAGGAFREFEKLKEEGLIRHICVSTHMAGPEIEEMLQDYPFEGLLVGYSAMNFPYRDAGLDSAARRNLGVAVMNPLGGGIIPQHPDRFSFVKTREDETVVEGALRFLLNDSRITTALVGFSRPEEIAEAVRAVDGFQPISGADLERIRSSLKESFNQLCTGCRYCDSCPQGVPVPKLMEAYNHYALSGKSRAILSRLRMHWAIQPEDELLRKCVKCRLCEEACTQKLPIIQRIEAVWKEADGFLEEKSQKVMRSEGK